MKDSSRAELMRKVQETSFACVDMNLYLDNHLMIKMLSTLIIHYVINLRKLDMLTKINTVL